MKKRKGTASERASAMVLGGAICSRETSKYPGPLFARKKTNYLGRFFLFIFVVGVAVSFSERSRKKALGYAKSFLNPGKKLDEILQVRKLLSLK
ncbi:MAG: hypothetical protein R3A80_05585 [Bdellovibrionota bacterium]